MLAGPLLRRLTPTRLLLWLVGSAPLDLTLALRFHADGREMRERIPLGDHDCRKLAVGRHAWLHFIDVAPSAPLPVDTVIHYDLLIAGPDGREDGMAAWAPHLLHEGAGEANFVLRARLDNILFGSCRKPHHSAPDGLVRADALVAAADADAKARPALLMLCGDQVYADDVAGPSLVAIHALIPRLGLYGEHLEGAVVADSQALYAHPDTYYRREELLPAFRSNEALRERFFGGVEKPVFTTASAHNHLVTLAEVMATYLLAWSPVPWRLAEGAPVPQLAPEHACTYAAEAQALARFRQELPRAARVLAHVQTLMIFDDHDITDDWNLSAKWEATAYGHPFSRRIVGNALVGYALCQAWGNDPDTFTDVLDEADRLFATAGTTGTLGQTLADSGAANAVDVDVEASAGNAAAASGHARPDSMLDCRRQDALIGRLLGFGRWHYTVRTTPALIVLDTRTHRWRSRRLPSRPSGLMDWEALCELQQELLDEPAAVIVSPAPMFGVKLIEAVQRAFTWAGHSLLVDAENWMAHRGAAHVMLNIFRHSRTPGNYVVLSGDVHYSFVYDVHLRDRRDAGGPHIWQITSSGLKNEFPRRLLDWLDRLNRWLYAPWSPLNWLTKRRHLEIRARLPDRRSAGERLWNSAGVGQVLLDEQGRPVQVLQHNADGSPPTRFVAPAEHGGREPSTIPG